MKPQKRGRKRRAAEQENETVEKNSPDKEEETSLSAEITSTQKYVPVFGKTSKSNEKLTSNDTAQVKDSQQESKKPKADDSQTQQLDDTLLDTSLKMQTKEITKNLAVKIDVNEASKKQCHEINDLPKNEDKILPNTTEEMQAKTSEYAIMHEPSLLVDEKIETKTVECSKNGNADILDEGEQQIDSHGLMKIKPSHIELDLITPNTVFQNSFDTERVKGEGLVQDPGEKSGLDANEKENNANSMGSRDDSDGATNPLDDANLRPGQNDRDGADVAMPLIQKDGSNYEESNNHTSINVNQQPNIGKEVSELSNSKIPIKDLTSKEDTIPALESQERKNDEPINAAENIGAQKMVNSHVVQQLKDENEPPTNKGSDEEGRQEEAETDTTDAKFYIECNKDDTITDSQLNMLDDEMLNIPFCTSETKLERTDDTSRKISRKTIDDYNTSGALLMKGLIDEISSVTRTIVHMKKYIDSLKKQRQTRINTIWKSNQSGFN